MQIKGLFIALGFFLVCGGCMAAMDSTTINKTEITKPASEVISVWKGTALETVAPQVTISVYLPEEGKKNETSVVLIPGGGYAYVSDIKEGSNCAKWLNERGITAFVLNYRVAPNSLHPAPLMDATRAMRIIRSRSAEWSINPEHIGIWGFSAGGHLAATLGTHFDLGIADSSDPIERISCKPNFMILAYPVITMDNKYTSARSRENVIGKDPSDKLIDELSVEKHVSSSTPATFIFTTDEDKSVPSENSVFFYLALRKAGVPAELHIYRTGKHGLNLAQQFPLLKSWPDLLESWIKGLGFLEENNSI